MSDPIHPIDRLRVSLALTIGSDAFAIPAGAIERFSLDAEIYGFAAEVTFHVSSELEEDTLFGRFSSLDLARAVLAVAGRVLAGTEEPSPPATFLGYVVERRVTETVSDDLAGSPIVGRRYSVRIEDPARVFWGQHRPLELHADTTLGEVLLLHKPVGVALKLAWPLLAEERAIVCLGLHGDHEATFYDFLIWFLARHGGVLELDCATASYRVAGAKAKGDEPLALDVEDLASIAVRAPEPRRNATRVLGAFAETPSTVPVPNLHAEIGVSHDVVLRTPLATTIARRAGTEANRLRAPEHGLVLQFQKCPEPLPVPGTIVTFDEGFSDHFFATRKHYRVIGLHVRATQEAGFGLDDPTASYAIELTSELELATDPTPRLPPFVAPRYPVVVEGRVLSASGEAEDRTWFSLPGDTDSLFRQRIEIPLWNETIVVPFEPNRSPGHLFFPPHKGQRALVALDFDSARVTAYLDWAANARVPAETQGNRIVLGKRAENGTLIEHVYADRKPELRIKRTLGGDVETVQLTEGVIFLSVREDPLVPKLEPRYDVKIQVSAAIGDVATKVGGAIGSVTGKFEGSMGVVGGALEGAVSEVDAALGAAEARLFEKLETAEAALVALAGGMHAAVEAVSAAVAEAKTALVAALEG